MINPRKRLREMIPGAVKDKASLIKATFTTRRAVSSVQAAIIRATTHASASPPPDHRVAAVIDLGNRSLPVICACIGAIMDRLHGTRDPFVALKCLYVIHNLVIKGSILFKDQISFIPAAGGNNSLNLSDFRSKSDAETRELSEWVRWYASVLEQNIMTFKVVGKSYVSCSSRKLISFNKTKIPDKDSSSSGYDVVKEMESLVCAVEGICRAPESLHWRKNDVVHEVMNLVADDYRSTQYEIMVRLTELSDRVGKLSYSELTELLGCLKRLEQCKERTVELFIRRRNNVFWEMTGRIKAEIETVKEEWERQSLVLWEGVGEKLTESTRWDDRVVNENKMIVTLLLPYY